MIAWGGVGVDGYPTAPSTSNWVRGVPGRPSDRTKSTPTAAGGSPTSIIKENQRIKGGWGSSGAFLEVVGLIRRYYFDTNIKQTHLSASNRTYSSTACLGVTTAHSPDPRLAAGSAVSRPRSARFAPHRRRAARASAAGGFWVLGSQVQSCVACHGMHAIQCTK